MSPIVFTSLPQSGKITILNAVWNVEVGYKEGVYFKHFLTFRLNRVYGNPICLSGFFQGSFLSEKEALATLNAFCVANNINPTEELSHDVLAKIHI